jgi:hypothetical protein
MVLGFNNEITLWELGLLELPGGGGLVLALIAILHS